MRVAGLSGRFDAGTVAAIPGLWRRFAPYLDTLAGHAGGTTTYGICSNGGSGGSFDYLCGIELQQSAPLPHGLVEVQVPAGRYAVFVHTGPVTELRDTWQAIFAQWLPASGIPPASGPQFERYSDQFDPRTGTGTVEIWIPVGAAVHAASEPAPSVPAGRPARFPAVRAWGRDLALSVLVSAFIIVFLYQPVRVEGTSMLPNLEDHDRLFINKLAFRVGEVHRGDVVVFQYPRDRTKSYIKRVIGLPGDRVEIDHGRVILNGRPLPEPYVPSRFSDDRSQPEMVIPANEFFVMGDHRSISSDSRDFGPVDRDLIYGKASFVYWPMDQAGPVR